MTSVSLDADRRPVPVRTILTTIGLVLATALLIYIVLQIRQVLTWIVIGAFFAVALYPVAGWVQRRLLGGRRRALATFLVFLVVFILLAALIAAFAVPLVNEGTKLAGQLPDLIDDARSGRGPIGDLLERTNALQWVQDNQDKISNFASGLTAPAAGVVSGFATGIAGTLTVFVLAYLMVLEGPKVVAGAVNVFRPTTGERIRRVGTDCAKSVTGYLSGNLLISFICGALTYVVLLIAGVPFAGLIALFVGIADLIPLVGATLGGGVAVLAGFLHSVPAGIAVLVFFVLYQQLENHLLQPLIFARTVKLNPLTVIVAILIGVELMGILGALLAIPVASMIQVILRDLWDHRQGELKDEPTVGEDREPALAPDRGPVTPGWISEPGKRDLGVLSPVTIPRDEVDPPRPRTWEHVLIVATTVHSGRRLHGSCGDTEWADDVMTRSRVDDILSALSEAGPQSSWPERLVEECRQATEMSGVGLALMGDQGAAGILAATSGHAQQMEDLQFELGEGPCMDASRSGRPVFCSDLALDGHTRWPVFAPGARQAGVEAAFTFPLQVGAVGLGVLDLYRDRRGPLTAPQVSEAVAFADASVAVLLRLQDDAGPASDARPGRAADNRGTGPARGPAGADWAELVDRRAVVHQAAGMISVQLDVDVAVALLRLRAYSFSHGRPISEVAVEVVARRLRFDDTDEGAAEGPGRPGPDKPPGEEPWR